jgi:hypothetical protein
LEVTTKNRPVPGAFYESDLDAERNLWIWYTVAMSFSDFCAVASRPIRCNTELCSRGRGGETTASQETEYKTKNFTGD